MEYKGLILGQQKDVHIDTEHWKFGIVRNGVKVIDTLLHYSAYSLGYDDHGIIDKVCESLKNFKPEVADGLFMAFEPALNSPHVELADKLYKMSNGYRPVFALSGSDGVEVAIKIAFAYHQKIGNKKNKIVSFDDGYHGMTLLSLSCGDKDLEKAYYGMNPYQDVIKLSRNNLDVDVDWSDVACIIIETCPHNKDIEPYGVDVWNKVKEIQDKYGVLVIIDDVFMGGGKTGSFFGWDKLPVNPDLFVMGKAITGGFFPLSIAMYNEKLHEELKDSNWRHGHTYSFSLSGVLSMLEYLNVLEQHNYMDNVENIIELARTHFENAGWQIIGNYGITFILFKNGNHFRFILPLNADQEYFDAIPDTLKGLEELWLK